MKRWIRLFAALVVSTAFASIIAAVAFANSTKSGGATVAVAKTRIGRILVDSKGITLYDFVTDKGGVSGCYGACAALWPPMITKGKPHAGPGVRASLLGGASRKDSKLEVPHHYHA